MATLSGKRSYTTPWDTTSGCPDAFEWVEAPNTIGMSQFADSGLLASKPYAASGAYINRMSDYCGSCRYSAKARTGPGACPCNALYWHFLDHLDQYGTDL